VQIFVHFVSYLKVPFLKPIRSDDRSDQELVDAYRQSGDLPVLGTLYARYMELVYGVCMKYLKESELARDATMQIFESLVVTLRRHEVSNFKSWLHTLAKNHCLMQLRSPKILKTVEFNGQFVQSEENAHLNCVLEKEENLVSLEKCIEGLGEEQRLSIRLFYLQQKSYQEVSQETGLDLNKVRSLIQNGRRNLKICMDRNKTAIVHE
jgi:RNA polymerase sigma factor (sigma-70 family)